MSVSKNYLTYLHDNPEGYWFKRKLYGWGWVPAQWQGWLVLGVWVGALVLIVRRIESHLSLQTVSLTAFIPLAVMILLLIGICYYTGEKPQWQWGQKRD